MQTYDIEIKYIGDDMIVQVLDEDLVKSDLVS